MTRNLEVDKRKGLIRKGLSSFYQSKMDKEVSRVIGGVKEVKKINNLEVLLIKRDQIIDSQNNLGERLKDIKSYVKVFPNINLYKGVTNIWSDIFEIEQNAFNQLADSLEKVDEQISLVQNSRKEC